MNTWRELTPSSDCTHHVGTDAEPGYSERFDEVLKFHAPGLAPVSRDGDAWHITADGAPAYARRFLRTFGFYEGRAAVAGCYGWHHVDIAGVDAYAARYAWCGNFQGGRCPVRDERGNYFHILPDGEALSDKVWRYAGDYRDGVAVVQATNGLSTHVDSLGALLHDRWFVDLDVFHKGFARARDQDGWLHIDRQGEPLYRRRFAAVEPFYNGQARVERHDGGLVVIDEAGETIAELRPARVSELAALSSDMVGYWRTQTIAIAVELGVFEALPASLHQLTERCDLSQDGAVRLLRALGELRLVDNDTGTWRATRRGALLRSDHPLTLADGALEYAGPLGTGWRELAAALGLNTGWTPPNIFSDVAANPERRGPHHRMLRSYARHDYASIPHVLGLGDDARVVDAGGGLGTLALALLDAQPTLQVTVLDLPEVVTEAAGLGPSRSGLHWQAGDIFAPWNLSADAVVLARVLHDWDDAQAISILQRAVQTLRPSGCVYIVEMVLSENGFGGGLCDLHLLATTGGRERTEEGFRQLLGAAGLTLTAVRPSSGLPTVLVGRRA